MNLCGGGFVRKNPSPVINDAETRESDRNSQS